jgi:hypothetical protein
MVGRNRQEKNRRFGYGRVGRHVGFGGRPGRGCSGRVTRLEDRCIPVKVGFLRARGLDLLAVFLRRRRADRFPGAGLGWRLVTESSGASGWKAGVQASRRLGKAASEEGRRKLECGIDRGQDDHVRALDWSGGCVFEGAGSPPERRLGRFLGDGLGTSGLERERGIPLRLIETSIGR